MARRARTRVPQPDKTPVAAVPILPLDLEALAGRLLHAHFGRRHRLARQLLFRRALRLFRADQANPFVTHIPLLPAAQPTGAAGSASRRLQKRHRLQARDFEPLPAPDVLAGHHVVLPHHVGLGLGKPRTIPFVSMFGQLRLPRPHQPPNLVLARPARSADKSACASAARTSHRKNRVLPSAYRLQ